MPEVDLLAIAVTTVIAIVFSGAFYSVLGPQLAKVSEAAAAAGPPSPAAILAEVVRSSVLVTVIAAIVVQTGTDSWTGGLWLGVGLFIGFPAVLWAGAMLHEKQDWRLAAIHGGDWLVKVPLVAVVLSVWQ